MLAVGDQLDHYRVGRPLGRGGEAAVFQATDLQTNRPVVLKVLDPATLGEVAAFERLRREIAIGRLLQHPGVPRLLEAHEDARPPYLVLEYTEGQSLATIIKKTHPIPLSHVLQLATGLVEVVAYCHGRHVYHRDLKPENILVDAQGQVKIIDFGIALLEGAARVTWRGFSGLVGTPEYMAPEQIRGERGGAETDVYALGLILYELLAGRPPYRAANPLSTMYQHLNMTPQRLQELRGDVPRAIAAIVAKAMRRRPAERYPNAAALYEALTHPETVGPTILDRPDPPLSPRGRESVLSQPLLLTVLVAVATAVLVIVAELLLHR